MCRPMQTVLVLMLLIFSSAVFAEESRLDVAQDNPKPGRPFVVSLQPDLDDNIEKISNGESEMTIVMREDLKQWQEDAEKWNKHFCSIGEQLQKVGEGIMDEYSLPTQNDLIVERLKKLIDKANQEKINVVLVIDLQKILEGWSIGSIGVQDRR